jgi:hypothetical protein
MAGNAGQRVPKVGEGFHIMALAGRDDAEEDRGGAPAVVAAGEQPVLAADGDAAQGVLGGVVRRGYSRR